MSIRFPAVTSKQIIKLLEQKGFIKVRQSGSHAIFHHANGNRTTVPIHSSKSLGIGLLKQIMRDTGISENELREFI